MNLSLRIHTNNILISTFKVNNRFLLFLKRKKKENIKFISLFMHTHT